MVKYTPEITEGLEKKENDRRGRIKMSEGDERGEKAERGT